MNVNYCDYYSQYYYTIAKAMNTRQRIKENKIIFKAQHVNFISHQIRNHF